MVANNQAIEDLCSFFIRMSAYDDNILEIYYRHFEGGTHPWNEFDFVCYKPDDSKLFITHLNKEAYDRFGDTCNIMRWVTVSTMDDHKQVYMYYRIYQQRFTLPTRQPFPFLNEDEFWKSIRQ